jgi:hypothetical protein
MLLHRRKLIALCAVAAVLWARSTHGQTGADVLPEVQPAEADILSSINAAECEKAFAGDLGLPSTLLPLFGCTSSPAAAPAPG